MKKVYIVEAFSGEYEEFRKWIHAVYLTEEEAIKSRDELKDRMKKLKEIPCPVDESLVACEEDSLSDEDYELYRSWVNNQDEAERFNTAFVKEYEIGKIYEH